MTTWSTFGLLVYMHLLCRYFEVLWWWCHTDVFFNLCCLCFTIDGLHCQYFKADRKIIRGWNRTVLGWNEFEINLAKTTAKASNSCWETWNAFLNKLCCKVLTCMRLHLEESTKHFFCKFLSVRFFPRVLPPHVTSSSFSLLSKAPTAQSHLLFFFFTLDMKLQISHYLFQCFGFFF